MKNYELIKGIEDKKANANVSIKLRVSREELENALEQVKDEDNSGYTFWTDVEELEDCLDDEVILIGGVE